VIEMTTAEIADIVDGVVTGPGDTPVAGAAFVDSRTPVPGGLFAAVKGEHVDGHDYAAATVRAGAAAVLSQRPLGVPGVVVADTVAALAALARHMAGRLANTTVVGITGSQGKTSTKDLLAQLLETRGKTVAPIGSFNTEIGVPLTVLRADLSTDFLVVEMGARGVGHIRFLTDIVAPHIGVVLNVGVAHLGEFGSRAAIAQAKGELVEALRDSGVAVLNADDDLVSAMRSRTSARTMSFGRSPAADVGYRDVQLDGDGHVCLALAYDGAERSVTVPLIGRQHAGNVAAATAAALACGLSFDEICTTLASAGPRSHWRMETTVRQDGVTVINDAYNANPDSMRAALETLAEIGDRRGGDTRTFAVLGEMAELGESSHDEHAALGRLLVTLGISDVLAVGEAAGAIARAASAEAAWRGTAVCVPDKAAATDYVQAEVRPGDVVLVKASRAVGLETVATALLPDRTTAAR
jgi:UDP-N-acetylmuramoyl-tripeptide--D-alanyl-D-alanine ligase